MTNEDHDENKSVRCRIIEAAMECAAENGINGISAREISRLAGSSYGSMYNEFSNLGNIKLFCAEKILDIFDSDIPIDESYYWVTEFINEAALCMSQAYDEIYREYYVDIATHQQKDERFRHLYMGTANRIIEYFKSLIVKGQDIGQIDGRISASGAASFIFSSIEMTIISNYFHDEKGEGARVEFVANQVRFALVIR